MTACAGHVRDMPQMRRDALTALRRVAVVKNQHHRAVFAERDESRPVIKDRQRIFSVHHGHRVGVRRSGRSGNDTDAQTGSWHAGASADGQAGSGGTGGAFTCVPSRRG